MRRSSTAATSRQTRCSAPVTVKVFQCLMAASLADYDYFLIRRSKSANVVWNEETLDKWLTDLRLSRPAPRCSSTWKIRKTGWIAYLKERAK